MGQLRAWIAIQTSKPCPEQFVSRFYLLEPTNNSFGVSPVAGLSLISGLTEFCWCETISFCCCRRQQPRTVFGINIVSHVKTHGLCVLHGFVFGLTAGQKPEIFVQDRISGA
jgi:hypothetical protein